MSIDSSVVPKLAIDGSNADEWENALVVYATAKRQAHILLGTMLRPKRPEKGLLMKEPGAPRIGLPDEARRKETIQQIRENNDKVEETYRQEVQRYRESLNANCNLKFLIVNSVPQNVWNRVKGFENVSDQFEVIMSWYHEPCSKLWGDFIGLRHEHCRTTVAFVNKFKISLAKLEHFENCRLNKYQKVYQLILAVKRSFPMYAKRCQADLPSCIASGIDDMCDKLISLPGVISRNGAPRY